jgi:hypothetical protein
MMHTVGPVQFEYSGALRKLASHNLAHLPLFHSIQLPTQRVVDGERARSIRHFAHIKNVRMRPEFSEIRQQKVHLRRFVDR